MARSTLYDRFKQTGYLTGPRHSMLGRSADSPVLPDGGGDPGGMGPDDPDTPGADQGAGGPPNLRDSQDVTDACTDCANFSGEQCTKFNTSVTPNQVCDDFEEGVPDNGQEEQSTGPEVSPEARP